MFIIVNCTLCLNCLEEVCVDFLEYIQCLLNLAVLCCDSHYIVLLLTFLAGPVHRCHGTFIPAAVY